MYRSSTNRLLSTTSPITTASADPRHYFQKGGIIEAKKLGSSNVSGVSLKLPPFAALEIRQAKSSYDEEHEKLLGSEVTNNFSLFGEHQNLLETTVLVKKSSSDRCSASMVKTHRRSVKFAPSVCVHEHGLEMGNIKLCMPTIFNDRPFCRSGLPVQLSDEHIATYFVPLEHMGDRVVFPQSLYDQEHRLLTVGRYNRSDVLRGIAQYRNLQQQQGQNALDNVDRNAILFCAERESDAAFIHSEHIPRMFLQGLHLSSFGADVALAEWYRRCQFFFGAENASAMAHRRALHLQQYLGTAAEQSNDGVELVMEYSATTVGRKRSFGYCHDGSFL